MDDKHINDGGREIERQNADAGLDVEAVLRLFLTGDGFIAECDIPHIVAALTAQPAVGEEIMFNAAHDVYTLPLQPSGLDGRGPRFVVHVPAQADQAQHQGEKHE